MTNDKGILIKNIYYMLTYAFQVLRQKNYDEIAAEKFDEVQDLFAAILAKGISQQLKHGLYRVYEDRTESLTVMRGKLDINGMIQNRIQQRQLLSCSYDELTENNVFNQILKTTAVLLLRSDEVKAEQRTALKKVMLFFNSIDTIDPKCISWGLLTFQRNNQNYQMLLNICYFVLEGMLQTTEQGKYKLAQFSDEHMARLYERFVLEYFKKHYAPSVSASASQIKWDLQGETESRDIRFLPIMQTDITLRYNGRTLIIDTKYYGRTMQTQYDTATYHSSNLYQIFTYVKNEDKDASGCVSGMLLYAKTSEAITPDSEYNIGGNPIIVNTLDLNCEFSGIAKQLDSIINKCLGVPLEKRRN